jgi:hypothetical protein
VGASSAAVADLALQQPEQLASRASGDRRRAKIVMVEQVCVTRDDCVCSTFRRERDEVVVVAITYDARRIGWVRQHDREQPQSLDQVSPLSRREAGREVRLLERPLDLHQDSRAGDQVEDRCLSRVE